MVESEMFGKLAKVVLEGDEEGVMSLVQEVINSGITPLKIITEGMALGVREAGDKFSKGEYFLPQLIMASEAMRVGLALILPLITADARKEASGNVVIGSVEGDVHDIGKNIVSAMLIASGFYVIDLGVDVPSATFVGAVEKESPHILALGSYMSTTLPAMDTVIKDLEKAGLRDKVKVMIGGVATTPEYARKIGADGYAADAPEVVRVAQQLLGQEAGAPMPKEESYSWRGITTKGSIE